MRFLWRLVSVLTAHSVVDGKGNGVEDPAIQADQAVDQAFPKTAGRALREFHCELVEDGAITDQAAVTYGIRFLEHMLATVESWDSDDEDDDEEA